MVCDKTTEELEASVQKEVDDFFESCKKKPEKPYFKKPNELRKMVDERTKKRREDDRPKPQERSDYDRTLDKAVKAKKAGKGVPQLGQQENNQSLILLFVMNLVQTTSCGTYLNL